MALFWSHKDARHRQHVRGQSDSNQRKFTYRRWLKEPMTVIPVGHSVIQGTKKNDFAMQITQLII
jgi:hypothetical protein